MNKRSALYRAAQLLVCLSCAGCLSSESPFYTEADVMQDATFVGKYDGESLAFSASVSQSTQSRYLVRIDERGGFSEFTGTLFRVGKSTYLDLFPIRENKLFTASRDGQPSLSFMLKRASHLRPDGSGQKLHVLFRVEISERGIVCWAPKSKAESDNPISGVAELRVRPHTDGFLIDGSIPKFRSILAGEERARVFNEINPISLHRAGK